MASTAPVKIGGTAPGDTTVDVPRILNTALGLPMQLVEGYKGTAQIRLASETGEVHGSCWQWESVRVTWSRAIESGDVVVALQITPKALPDLPNVPLAVSYAKTDEARELIKMGVYEPASITRPYFLPPGTPKEQVQMLRKAFQETVKDPDFLAEAAKARLAIDPMTGEEIGEVVKGLFDMSPTLKTKLKNMLYPKR